MPSRSYYPLSGRKRRAGKSRSKSRRAKRILAPVPMRISNSGVPRTLRATMKYVTHIPLTSGVVALQEHIFRAFSIYDPDVTGVGHQPLAHDQWAQLYRKYRVLNSKISVKCVNELVPTLGANYTATTCVLAVAEQGVPISNSETLAEYPSAKTRYIGNYQGASADMSLEAISPRDSGTLGSLDNNWAASFGANPTLDLYYHVIADRRGSAQVDVRAQVTIEYDVYLYDAIDLSGS